MYPNPKKVYSLSEYLVSVNSQFQMMFCVFVFECDGLMMNAIQFFLNIGQRKKEFLQLCDIQSSGIVQSL